MEQQTPTPPPSASQPPQLPQQPPPPPSPSPPTPITTTTTTSSTALPPPASSSSLPHPANPTPTSTSTSTSTSTPHTRPAAAAFNRAWQQPPHPTPFSHFSLPPPPLPLPPHSSSSSSTASAAHSSSPSLPVSSPPRGGMAIGVPAHHPGTPPPPPTSFPSLTPPSFGRPFGGLGRNVTDSGPTSTSSQVRPTVGGMQGIGMMGTLGASSAMLPPGSGGIPLRPVQSSPRPQTTPGILSPASQNFQGHGMLRVSSVGSPASPSPGSLQSPQPLNQPWLNSGSQVKLPLSPSRPQVSPQSMQQRSHISQQHHHAMATTSQQQQASSAQQSQQPSTSGAGSREHFGQQFPQSRIQQTLLNQQQIARNPSLGTQRPHSTIPSSPVQSGLPNRAPSAEPEEPCNRILSKRSIQELVTQVDPSEKLDPEVEDILVDIAEDFVESITTFGCSLAKHRKSTTLEAKDILLHLERNWNITLPGFSGDEIKMYKKPFTSDIHRERLAVIKKSILAGETTNSRSLGQAGGNPKGHLAKGPTSIVGSPTTKVREAA